MAQVAAAGKKRMLEGNAPGGPQGKRRKHEERGVYPSNASGLVTAPARQPFAAKKPRKAPALCEHQRVRSRCKDCGGIGICEHQRQKLQLHEYSDMWSWIISSIILMILPDLFQCSSVWYVAYISWKLYSYTLIAIAVVGLSVFFVLIKELATEAVAWTIQKNWPAKARHAVILGIYPLRVFNVCDMFFHKFMALIALWLLTISLYESHFLGVFSGIFGVNVVSEFFSICLILLCILSFSSKK